MINSHTGNGRLFSDFLGVAIHSWVSLSCSEVWAPVGECQWVGAVCLPPSSGRDGAASQASGAGHRKRPRGHLSSGPWNLLDSQVQSICAAFSVGGRNFQEQIGKPATDSGLHHMPRLAKASFSVDSSTALGLLRPRRAGPRTAQRRKPQSATGPFSLGSHCSFNNRPLPKRETDRQTDREGGASFDVHVPSSQTWLKSS